MFLFLDVWLIPAIAAGSSSYLVSLLWERLRPMTAPSGLQESFLVILSFLMGCICAFYRDAMYASTLENNTVVMFAAGATATFLWLCLRKYLPVSRGGSRTKG
jgi:hypothetical protein